MFHHRFSNQFYFNPRSLVGNDEDLHIASPLSRDFNPRSLVGNDMPDCAALCCRDYFNPRSLVGNDLAKMREKQTPWSISIHVPSWGTTSQSYICKASPHDFNPRSLVGNDGKFSQIFFVFLCNKYNFSTFYYPFSLFFSVIHVTFLIFVVRILPAFYVYF